MSGLNAISGIKASSISFKQNEEVAKTETEEEIPALKAADEDKVELTKNEKTKPNPPQISKTRLAFSVLKDSQVEQINQAGKLPENAKFVMNGYGGYAICNNFFNLRAGTQEIPQGFEVKKNALGFAVVLPKGTKGALIK